MKKFFNFILTFVFNLRFATFGLGGTPVIGKNKKDKKEDDHPLAKFFKSFKSLIVHGGGAHGGDDVLIMALMAYYNPLAPIFRRNPTEKELKDPRILVADVGQKYVPGWNNFDHHQELPDGKEGLNALGLIMDHVEFNPVWGWWPTAQLIDCKGPGAPLGNEHFADVINIRKNPINSWFIGLLVGQEELNGYAKAILSSIGEAMMNEDKVLREALDSFRVVNYHGVQIAILKDEILQLRGPIQEIGIANGWNVIVMPSDREGESWMLLRIANHLRVDFCKLTKDERVGFVHSGGFIAKLKEGTKDPLPWVHKAISP